MIVYVERRVVDRFYASILKMLKVPEFECTSESQASANPIHCESFYFSSDLVLVSHVQVRGVRGRASRSSRCRAVDPHVLAPSVFIPRRLSLFHDSE